ncbi:MAG: DUF1203 domain-containing protein [Alphaproteobacteria bacterium]|nr:DUF1203 domain-containing protein [Alphaproteobacteria bacterium]MBN9568523.1 DUF1203 domain-containing protein [Alphaproteobacteria bacterium]
MSFRVSGLAAAPFQPLFALSDEVLAARAICRVIADEKPGFPCRVSLEDANPGERLLLLPYEHQTALTPYRASGPIFVREQAGEAFDRVGEIPPVLRSRLLSLRAYDGEGTMLDADVTEGGQVEDLIVRLFSDARVQTIHAHFARRGCYACRIGRA